MDTTQASYKLNQPMLYSCIFFKTPDLTPCDYTSFGNNIM